MAVSYVTISPDPVLAKRTAARRPTLVVMVKEPRAGRVKTRLGRDIGTIPATWWFRHQLAGLLRRLDDPRWDTVLCVAPDRAWASRMFPAHRAMMHPPRLPQGGGDLGARMRRGLMQHTGPTCLIGGDVPGIDPGHVARAFRAIGAHDLVFGPAPDGGFWLVGARHPAALPPGFMAGCRWSSSHALADAMGTAPGARIALVDSLRDVDRAADLP